MKEPQELQHTGDCLDHLNEILEVASLFYNLQYDPNEPDSLARQGVGIKVDPKVDVSLWLRSDTLTLDPNGDLELLIGDWQKKTDGFSFFPIIQPNNNEARKFFENRRDSEYPFWLEKKGSKSWIDDRYQVDIDFFPQNILNFLKFVFDMREKTMERLNRIYLEGEI